MESIQIIREKSDLEGTCYIELSLGKFRGKHWEETSLFLRKKPLALSKRSLKEISLTMIITV